MQLSPNFELIEFMFSETAVKQAIPNLPSNTEIANLRLLVVNLLQPLRTAYGESFIVNSGFRSPQLNKAVGGVASSQHVKGQAADIRVNDPRKLLAKLRESGLSFDQAILYPTFLHLSYNEGNNRNQILFAKGAKP